MKHTITLARKMVDMIRTHEETTTVARKMVNMIRDFQNSPGYTHVESAHLRHAHKLTHEQQKYFDFISAAWFVVEQLKIVSIPKEMEEARDALEALIPDSKQFVIKDD